MVTPVRPVGRDVVHGANIAASKNAPRRGLRMTVALPALIFFASMTAKPARRRFRQPDRACRAIRVTAVRSGEAALTQIEREKPDLVMLDLTMPEIDGLEVLRRLRRVPVGRTAHHHDRGCFGRRPGRRCLRTGCRRLSGRPVHVPVALARLRSQLARCAAIAARAAASASVCAGGRRIERRHLGLGHQDRPALFLAALPGLFGFDKDAALHRLNDWANLLHPDDIDVFQLGLRNHLEGISLSFQVEVRMLHQNQSYRWF